MELTEYTELLRRELGSVTRFGGEEFARTAEMLADALDSSVRLILLEALSAAAAEITVRLDGPVVEVRLSGSTPQFVVTPAPGEVAPEAAPEPAAAPFGEPGDDMARITLRLPGPLKAQVEDRAAAEGTSVNAWLVRAVSRGLTARPGRGMPPPPPGAGFGTRFTGYGRG